MKKLTERLVVAWDYFWWKNGEEIFLFSVFLAFGFIVT